MTDKLGRYSGLTVFVTSTPKGGAGKTETADLLEAGLTLSGSKCVLVDVDDGNRGLKRRVGERSVVKTDWTSSVMKAFAWLGTNAADADALIFDLGAGIDSSDLPIMAFLATVWSLLQQGGARIIFCAVVSTNAPTSSFIDRIGRSFGDLGEVAIVCNNQDGSKEFPKELAGRPEPKLNLRQLAAGIQSVRLARQEPLSTVLRTPASDYHLATALMAQRLLAFAAQPIIREVVSPAATEWLDALARRAAPRLHFTVSRKALATDAAIELNARVARADDALLAPGIEGSALLDAARAYRRERAAWAAATRTLK
ncbi:hypothetical protein J2Y54_002198 [Sphingomonas sp. BE123]|uniref:hypothetical protein n=1 Tax=Sphingomonas sp. BE123 TaxID=2817842 RepID=UPI00285DB21F|nr:hypothetical protein [Sphingomonas sp. BE123]MDR6852678.1 hypothetical protein [Sphingomonas sp. BE123]